MFCPIVVNKYYTFGQECKVFMQITGISTQSNFPLLRNCYLAPAHFQELVHPANGLQALWQVSIKGHSPIPVLSYLHLYSWDGSHMDICLNTPTRGVDNSRVGEKPGESSSLGASHQKQQQQDCLKKRGGSTKRLKLSKPCSNSDTQKQGKGYLSGFLEEDEVQQST